MKLVYKIVELMDILTSNFNVSGQHLGVNVTENCRSC